MNVNDTKPILGFSCLKMKKEIQEEIYNETKDMTKDELREYHQRRIDLWEREREQLERK
jgi:hypothetical protein